jgi:aminoglycoside phosphotransferase family enzyme/predicted kinase
MTTPETRRLLEFLSDPKSYPHDPTHVTLVQTHASWVFLAPPFVYKVKKPVNFGFLDFSTLELRHADCERELMLNRRLTDDIYLGLEAVCDQQGKLQFGAEGTVVEWVVKMREMESRFFLTELLRDGHFGIAEMERIVDRLQRFYEAQPALPSTEIESARELMHAAVMDNLDTARGFVGRSLSQPAFDAITRFTTEFESHHQKLLDLRRTEGRIRDCHGDLHLEHIHLTPGSVNIYDCIEFNTEFRHIDVACDIAFLAMDLDFNGRPDLSAYIVDRFAVLLNDGGMKRIMDFYKCYRACVRGKVESLHSIAETVKAAEQHASLDLASRYYQLALRYAISGSRPHAFIVMGKVASGKSALASALAQETGWKVVSSDRTRKNLAAVPLHQRGNADARAALYAAEVTGKVYFALFSEALETLHQGHSIILDATFSSRAQRSDLLHILDNAGFAATWIEAQTSDAIAMERLRQRDVTEDVVSDARAEDYAKLSGRYEPPDELSASVKLTLSTNTESKQTIHHLLTTLARRRASAS